MTISKMKLTSKFRMLFGKGIQIHFEDITGFLSLRDVSGLLFFISKIDQSDRM